MNEATTRGDAYNASVVTGPPESVPLDSLSHWVDIYQDASRIIDAEEERRKVARSHIERALGDCEVGTIGGLPRVRWTFVTSRRLDQSKIPGDLKDEWTVVTTSRRFTLV